MTKRWLVVAYDVTGTRTVVAGHTFRVGAVLTGARLTATIPEPIPGRPLYHVAIERGTT